MRIIPYLAVSTGVDSYTIQIHGADGSVGAEPIRAGQGRPHRSSGMESTTRANRVADGKYSATLAVSYYEREQAHGGDDPFFVDNHVPQIDVSADALLFSPTPDSKLSGGDIKQSSSTKTCGKGRCRSSAGQKVRGWFWKGKAADFAWDGKDDNGNLMPDGYYTTS